MNRATRSPRSLPTRLPTQLPRTRIRTFDLDHDQLLVLEDQAGTRVRVLYGGVWLTEQGRPDDRFALAGAELLLHERGRALLGGMGRSRLELTPPSRRWADALTRRIDAMRRGVTRALAPSFVARTQARDAEPCR